MKKLPVLGQQAFLLSPEGDVVRTMVGRVYQDGHYVFLNGLTNSNRHWFSYDEALAAAFDRVTARKAELRKELRRLTELGQYFATNEYRESVCRAPCRVKDIGDDEERLRTRTRKHVALPREYTAPGTRVYVIITPLTEPRGSDWLYRPYPRFVLETEVRSVWVRPDGMACYSYATAFRSKDHFLTLEGATKMLQSFRSGTLGVVPFVSMEEEKTESEKIDDIPF